VRAVEAEVEPVRAAEEEVKPVRAAEEEPQQAVNDVKSEQGEEAKEETVAVAQEAEPGPCSRLSRDDLMKFRFADDVADAPPHEVETLRAGVVDAVPARAVSTPKAGAEQSWRAERGDNSKVPGRAMFGGRRNPNTNQGSFERERERRPKEVLPEKSENAYVVKRAGADGGEVSRAADLDRRVLSTLNKMCPENVRNLAEKIKDLDIGTAEELEQVIHQIFKKALKDTHYCETYADLVFYLREELPSFPNPAGGKPISFKSVLLTACQNEYMQMPKTLDDPSDEGKDKEDIDFARMKRKEKILANIKFVGNLFLRNLLRPQIIGQIMNDLTGSNEADKMPDEHLIECLLKLILTIGFTLDGMEHGNQSLTQVQGRLMELKKSKDKKTKKDVYSKRVQFAIQDLIDIRRANWETTSFKAEAKTMEEIRKEQEGGKEQGAGDRKRVGLRPAYLNQDGSLKETYSRGQAAQPNDGWEEPKRKAKR